MPRITNWDRKSRTPKLEYRNRETGARAVLSRTPSSHRYKWRGVILVEGYPIWIGNYDKKKATEFREALKENTAPELTCPECPNSNVLVGDKSASGGAVKRWYDCPDCGYQSPAKYVYPAER